MQAVSYGTRSRLYSPLLPASSSQPRSIVERPRSGPMGKVYTYQVYNYPSFLDTAQACLKKGLGRFAPSALPHYKHVAAPGSINSNRLTAKPAREAFVSMCVCTEPVRTGIGAVCVDYGRPTWPITMLNHTDIPGTEKCFHFLFLAPHARTTCLLYTSPSPRD